MKRCLLLPYVLSLSQVIDVGSGKGYLCSFLSMQYNLQVFGIDCSSTNTRGAQERNRKLKKFSRAYQKHWKVRSNQEVLNKEMRDKKDDDDEQEERMQSHQRSREEDDGAEEREMKTHATIDRNNHMTEAQCSSSSTHLDTDALSALSGSIGSESTNDFENPFFTMLAPEVVEQASCRVSPSQLSAEERERRKRENLERKARHGKGNSGPKNLYSPLTSYVTAETELRTLITELEVRGEQYCTTLSMDNFFY